ncbi:PTS system protein [Klebsiella pneumoniae]|uniref:PTS system protein n=1 Tax=Klebsiella pneumoniae TaxID=573 RepID=A0A377V0X3_KLEPN|nr:PTS system protein [Klebsiella pneumoniae]
MTAKTAPKITLWEFFQQLGKTFMLPVALLSFCGIMLGIGSSLSSHDVLTLLPWLDMRCCRPIFIWMSKVGFLCLQLPAGHVLYRPSRWVWRERTKASPPSPASLATRSMNLAVNFWLDREGYSAHHRRRDPEGQQYPEHYQHSVNRYRDPRGR